MKRRRLSRDLGAVAAERKRRQRAVAARDRVGEPRRVGRVERVVVQVELAQRRVRAERLGEACVTATPEWLREAILMRHVVYTDLGEVLRAARAEPVRARGLSDTGPKRDLLKRLFSWCTGPRYV